MQSKLYTLLNKSVKR